MSVTSDISSLVNTSNESYTARASVVDNSVDSSTSTVTGDRNSGLFKNASKEMGKDDFLLLLVTQLRYQDPLNPMENTEFVSQLAQFRSLESSSNIESAIKEMNESFIGTVDAQKYSAQSLTNSSAVSLIGKNVRMQQTMVQWMATAGEKIPLRIHLGNDDSATVQIIDSDGEIIKEISASDKDSDNAAFIEWDGTDTTGMTAKPGTYGIYIVGQEGNADLYAFIQDIVSGVRFTSDGAMVKVGGKELSIGNILDVSSGNGDTIQGSLPATTAVSLLGKQIRVRQDTIRYNQQDNESVTVKISTGGRENLRVNLTDSSGEIVFSTIVKGDNTGTADFSWNGETVSGKYAQKGEYKIHIEGEVNDPSIYAFKQGAVTGILNIGGNAQIRMGNTSVNLSDIVAIDSPESGDTV